MVGVLMSVGVMIVGVMTVRVMSVGEITVGVMTVGIMTIGVMRRPRLNMESVTCVHLVECPRILLHVNR